MYKRSKHTLDVGSGIEKNLENADFESSCFAWVVILLTSSISK
jgi:hypothetical protein